MPLFEIAVILVPTKKEAEDGAVEQLVFGPKPQLAKDGPTATIMALRGLDVDLNKAQVIVRPFA